MIAGIPIPRRGVSRLMTWFFVPAILAGLVVGQAWLFRAATCETYDEFTYLRMGICIYRLDDFKSLASPMCPPMPILLEYAMPALRAHSLPETPEWTAEVPGLIREARLMTSVLVGVPMVWLVFGWLAIRRGWAAGALGAGLLAMSPTFLAAASIATTDACFALFGVLALVAIHRFQVRPSRRTFLAVGVAIGLAMASKQSAAILFPVALVELLLKLPERTRGTRVDHGLRMLARLSGRMMAWVSLAFLVDWALYGFRFGPRFHAAGTFMTIPVLVPMVVESLPNGRAMMDAIRECGPPLAIDTFLGQMDHAARGHSAFLMGQRSHYGWWYYFPVALAIKSTPAELAMMGFVAANACRPSTWRDPAGRLWLVTIAAMLGAGMASSINIGHRYMLLVYPLAALALADRLGELLGNWRRWATTAGSILLIWQAVSVVGIAPHYLSYFNAFIGGPTEGYRYLVDSNLDWGQDLPSLRRELDSRGYRKVALCYFGTADPSNYDLRAVDWMEAEAIQCDWLAISATTLQGTYGGTSELIDLFGPLPAIRVGYSIFLYDMTDPRVREAVQSSRSRRLVPDPPIKPPGRAGP